MSKTKVDSTGIDLTDNFAFSGTVSGAGKIGQVVSTTKTDTFTTSNTDFTDITGLSVAITPSATSSKILLLINAQVGGQGSVNNFLGLKRGSTVIAVGDAASSRIRALASTMGNQDTSLNGVSASFLDSPSSTSELTFQVTGYSRTGQFYINRSRTDTDDNTFPRTISTITAIEVLA